MRILKIVGAGALIAVAMALAPPTMSAEVKLKVISGWPKSFPMVSKDYLLFIDEANKRGKGHFQMKWTGGAELGVVHYIYQRLF